jgi:phospholipase C
LTQGSANRKQESQRTKTAQVPIFRAGGGERLPLPAGSGTLEPSHMPSALPAAIANLPGVQALQHIVVLMMENRSFDHMLGFLNKPGMEGLTNQKIPDNTGTLQPVTQNAVYEGNLFPDPAHDLQDVNQQIFGNRAGTAGGPTMQGFIQDYFAQTNNQADSLHIMDCFAPAMLPVLAGLASGFGLCDHWYSSVPGPTLPNRAFVHFGTSFGTFTMSPFIGFWNQNKSIYQRLVNAGVPAKIYYSSTSSTFTSIIADEPLFFDPISQFFNTAAANSEDDPLPAYCFLEPSYSVPGGSDSQANDQHPDNNVQAGEQLILQVYQAIWGNDNLRNNTLLVIVYDEHGGLYDHCFPPAVPAESPDSPVFLFNRLGVRVPAILVSPWIDASVVDPTQYDHTSIPSSVTRLWVGDPATNSPSIREQQANCFLGNLSRATPRPKTDDPLAAQPSAAAFLENIKPQLKATAQVQAARPMSTLLKDQVQDAVVLNNKLPAGLQTGTDVSQLKTAGDAGTFINQVMLATQQHLASAATKEKQ